MRIQACTPLGNSIRLVWHCREMREPLCEWVDTDTAQYAEYIGKSPFTQTKQARKIILDKSSLTIYIDPIPDETKSTETIERTFVGGEIELIER